MVKLLILEEVMQNPVSASDKPRLWGDSAGQIQNGLKQAKEFQNGVPLSQQYL